MKNGSDYAVSRKPEFLFDAIIFNKPKIVQSLIEMGVSANLVFDHSILQTLQGYTPLHVAVFFNRIEIAQILIDLGADTECQTASKMTPLQLAYKVHLSPMCKSLIRMGANKDARDMWNNTLLHYANAYNQVDDVRFLLTCGASQNIKNDEGDKVLESSLKAKNHNIFKTIMYLSDVK